MMPADA